MSPPAQSLDNNVWTHESDGDLLGQVWNFGDFGDLSGNETRQILQQAGNPEAYPNPITSQDFADTMVTPANLHSTYSWPSNIDSIHTFYGSHPMGHEDTLGSSMNCQMFSPFQPFSFVLAEHVDHLYVPPPFYNGLLAPECSIDFTLDGSMPTHNQPVIPLPRQYSLPQRPITNSRLHPTKPLRDPTHTSTSSEQTSKRRRDTRTSNRQSNALTKPINDVGANRLQPSVSKKGGVYTRKVAKRTGERNSLQDAYGWLNSPAPREMCLAVTKEMMTAMIRHDPGKCPDKMFTHAQVNTPNDLLSLLEPRTRELTGDYITNLKQMTVGTIWYEKDGIFNFTHKPTTDVRWLESIQVTTRTAPQSNSKNAISVRKEIQVEADMIAELNPNYKRGPGQPRKYKVRKIRAIDSMGKEIVGSNP